MRLSTSALVLGAASTALGSVDQKPLIHPSTGGSGNKIEHDAPFGLELDLDSWTQPLKDVWGEISGDARAAWHEVAQLAPEAVEAFKQHALPTKPKKANRKPDSAWEHIVKGADVQGLTIKGADGQDRRKLGGKLDTYDMRVKKVDPSKLGVDTVKQYSGYLDDNENDKHLFYWFFESRNDPKNDPVVLWLNGGPGCSSMLGLFMELGPASINATGDIVHNPHSWNSNASVIFIDQPINTGFSYGGSSVSSSAAAGKDIYALLTLFFHQFPEYSTQDFHIAGESYGGHYVPIFSHEILKHEDRNINLKSIMVGNGLTDPYTQYAYYRPMACGEGGYKSVLSESECQSMDNALPRCQSLIQACYNSESAWTCVPALLYCNSQMIGKYQQSGMNPYDVRRKCENSNLCYAEMDWITEFLNRRDVQEAIGTEVDTFNSCNFDVNRAFAFNGDWMKPIVNVVPGLLEKLPVLIYAGDADFICNWLGNKAWTDQLEWPGAEDFAAAEKEDLTVGSGKKAKAYGNVKSAHNLTFVQVYEAGHMAPYDQPEGSLDFMNRWIKGEWLA